MSNSSVMPNVVKLYEDERFIVLGTEDGKHLVFPKMHEYNMEQAPAGVNEYELVTENSNYVGYLPEILPFREKVHLERHEKIGVSFGRAKITGRWVSSKITKLT